MNEHPQPSADRFVNPYAPPQIPDQTISPAYEDFAGLWRQGNLLVMHKKASLPFICLKSNGPAKRWLKRELHWYPKWALLLGGLFAMLLTRRATVNIGVSEEWLKRRMQRMLVAWGMVVGGAAMTFIGIGIAPLFGPNPNQFVFGVVVFLACGGPVFMIVGPVYGLTVCKLIAAAKITADHIWIRGVHPGFLDRLPEFHG